MSTPTVIHWFRRDLRIADNTALHHAAKHQLPVVPLYILSTWKKAHTWTGPNRQQFLCGSLASLDKNLSTIAGKLIIREGVAITEIEKLIRETGAIAIHYNRDPNPFGKQTETRLHQLCDTLGIECHGHHDIALHHPDEALTLGDKPYRVYTPFSKKWLTLEKPTPLPTPKSLDTPTNIPSLPLPTLDHWQLPASTATLPEPGERAARQRLKTAIEEKISTYQDLRDAPSVPGTSRLSQDLRYGLISIRTLYHQALNTQSQATPAAKTNIDTYIKELAWREFYFAILHHFPHVLDHEFNPDWRGLPWHQPDEKFDLWKQGRTGFPIVDAAMRELLATGFMHNRLRMITAMFLTKDLHLDWKLGESWFMQNLTDGEIASNNGGWQWSAGTGADAAPYFRIQNPWTQSSRHDPKGAYIKRWVPELKNTHPSLFAEPPKTSRPIAPDYPLPCLDHKTERDITLAIFKNHRNP